MSKEKAPEGAEPKKGGKMKKLLMLGIGGTVLISAGAGAGIYLGGGLGGHEAKPEDHYPKLVVRNEGEEPAAAEGEEGKEPAPKVGTVSVPNDRFKVDPRKYEITYYPMTDAFTTNLADGSGFLQVGISLSTFSMTSLLALKSPSSPRESVYLTWTKKKSWASQFDSRVEKRSSIVFPASSISMPTSLARPRYIG